MTYDDLPGYIVTTRSFIAAAHNHIIFNLRYPYPAENGRAAGAGGCAAGGRSLSAGYRIFVPRKFAADYISVQPMHAQAAVETAHPQLAAAEPDSIIQWRDRDGQSFEEIGDRLGCHLGARADARDHCPIRLPDAWLVCLVQSPAGCGQGWNSDSGSWSKACW